MAEEGDRWSRWLLDRRDAGLESQRERTRGHLAGIRDRVLEGAGPLEGATVLDVGAGDGLIGLAALERVGPAGRVIFSDVSPVLLERCRDAAQSLGLIDRARFVVAPAEDLAGIADASVDVLTTRSVLIYVAEKPRALAAFARVLRPQGGRISLFEPINRLMFPEPADRFHGYEIASVADLAAKVKAQFPPDRDDRAAMMGFDDRDLLDLTVAAGFARVRVECHLSVEPGGLMRPVSFDALLDSAPNPNAATVREAVTAVLNESDQVRFLTELRRAFDDDRAVRRMAGAYVSARTD
jgi:ubiquinone/menaquinone biosynthesis C-methylase UbiE